jgi:hypothetical protein
VSRRIVSVLRFGVVASIALGSGGCAYFHPAFVTNPQVAKSEDGVLVCERRTLTQSDCAVVPRREISRLLAEMTAGF